MAENIGATARAMMNCGLSELRVVAPRDGWPNPVAVPMAAGGAQIIENATVYDDIAAAALPAAPPAKRQKPMACAPGAPKPCPPCKASQLVPVKKMPHNSHP